MEISDAEMLAKELMQKHNVVWTFLFDRANKRTGCCRHSTRTISLSYEYVVRNDVDNIRNTILHEIAHAIAGFDAGHGPEWREICIRIGARPDRCCSDTVEMPKGRWQATCKSCNRTFNSIRCPKRRRHCRECGQVNGKLEYDFI